MNDNEDLELGRHLKAALPAVDLEPRRDLWPDVEKRLSGKKQAVPWFDWILLGAAAAGLVALPQIIPMLLYHL